MQDFINDVAHIVNWYTIDVILYNDFNVKRLSALFWTTRSGSQFRFSFSKFLLRTRLIYN